MIHLDKAVLLALALSLVSGYAEETASTAKPPDYQNVRYGGPFGYPELDSPEWDWFNESMKTRDERLAWWREARYGMFVHWGVYSYLGGEYKGRRGGAEHIQRVLKIPIEEYRKNVAAKFNPTEFDADEWIRLAKQAGMAYFVITSKHHDGFAMWPSKVSPANIADATPFDRDPMMELRDACRKYGLKFGFYYSHAFDWGEKNGAGNDWDFDNPGGDRNLGGKHWWLHPDTRGFITQARQYVDEKCIPQVLELIEMYDPDILWFDTPHKLPRSEIFRILKAVREVAPDIVVNGRVSMASLLGDYQSTTDNPAEFQPVEGDWEAIPTSNTSWGWNRFDNSHKPVSFFIQLLPKAVARGGNVLMNVGPMPTGEIDPKDVKILKGIGAWWAVNGESIRGCGRTPLSVQAWGESTLKGNTLYLHVFNWPTNGKLVVGGLKTKVTKAWLLSDPDAAPLKTHRLSDLDVAIDVPAKAPDAVNSVVVLECADTPEADPVRLLQPAVGEDTLRVFDAELRGEGLDFGTGKEKTAYVVGLGKPEQSVVWTTRIEEPATFDVELVYDATGKEGGSYTLQVGPRILKGAVKGLNGKPLRYAPKHTTSVGRVTLQPGDVTITLTPVDSSKELMRPRSVKLKAVSETK